MEGISEDFASDRTSAHFAATGGRMEKGTIFRTVAACGTRMIRKKFWNSETAA
jgi:hypothetical protein